MYSSAFRKRQFSRAFTVFSREGGQSSFVDNSMQKAILKGVRFAQLQPLVRNPLRPRGFLMRRQRHWATYPQSA